MGPDYHVHFRYRAEARDGYERYHYETMRFSEVGDAVVSLRKKGCDKFAIRRLRSLERWEAVDWYEEINPSLVAAFPDSI